MLIDEKIKTEIQVMIDHNNFPIKSVKEIAKELNILPLFSESDGWFGLNLAGEIISASLESPYQLRVETEKRIQNLVLFQGFKKYPSLKILLPVKTEADEICPDCKGTWIYPFPHPNVGCFCGGLGWLPKL